MRFVDLDFLWLATYSISDGTLVCDVKDINYFSNFTKISNPSREELFLYLNTPTNTTYLENNLKY